ncbi:MAG: hypothetical protein K1X53_00995 [Candidatus Sumerlaeaceae bacterium]|nr:hypothetical protein [Candidatus Sumerlaeaceae bacterium]
MKKRVLGTVAAFLLVPLFALGQAKEIVVESSSDGYNSQWFKTTEGNWLESAAKSTALGVAASKSVFKSSDGKPGAAVFSPEIPVAGKYEVFVTYPKSGNAAGVVYTVKSAEGEKKVVQDQNGRVENTQHPSDKWLSLGTYQFAQGAGGSVEIRDPATGKKANEKEPSGRTYADAVKFVPQGMALPADFANKVVSPSTAAPALASNAAPAVPLAPGLPPLPPSSTSPSVGALPSLPPSTGAAPAAPGLPSLSAAAAPVAAPQKPGMPSLASAVETNPPAKNEAEVKERLKLLNANLDAQAAMFGNKPTAAGAGAVPLPGLPGLPGASQPPTAGTLPALPPAASAPSGAGTAGTLPELPTAGAAPAEAAAAPALPALPPMGAPTGAPGSAQPLPGLPNLGGAPPVAAPLPPELPKANAAGGLQPLPSQPPAMPGAASLPTMEAPSSMAPPVTAPRASSTGSTPAPADGLPWNYDIGMSQQAAGGANKNILILFTAPGNRMVEKYEKEYFSSPAVRALFDKFVLLRVDFKQNTKFAYRSNVYGAGMISVMNSIAEPLLTLNTIPMTPEDLVKQLESVVQVGAAAHPLPTATPSASSKESPASTTDQAAKPDDSGMMQPPPGGLPPAGGPGAVPALPMLTPTAGGAPGAVPSLPALPPPGGPPAGGVPALPALQPAGGPPQGGVPALPALPPAGGGAASGGLPSLSNAIGATTATR